MNIYYYRQQLINVDIAINHYYPLSILLIIFTMIPSYQHHIWLWLSILTLWVWAMSIS